MTKKITLSVLLAVTFITTATLLYFFDLKMYEHSTTPSFIPYEAWSFVVLTVLYGTTLFSLIQNCNYSKQNHFVLEEKLAETTDALNDVQSSLDSAVEKKTFEMSVVNGSLNREIAERIQAESEGLRLRKRLEAILNSAGDGIFGIDIHGKVTFVNDKAIELLGWSEEEFIGKSHHDLVHHTHNDGTDYPIEKCPIYMAYKNGEVYAETDDIFWKKSGKNFSVEYTSTPLLDDHHNITGAVVVFKDISKSKKLKKQLELIVNSAGEGIFGLDTDGNVTFMNKAASIMLGWTQEELTGKSHHNLVHHSHSDGSHYSMSDCPIYMAYKDGQVHFKSDDVFWTKDGSNFTVEYTSTPIVEGNKISGAVVVFRDLTTFT